MAPHAAGPEGGEEEVQLLEGLEGARRGGRRERGGAEGFGAGAQRREHAGQGEVHGAAAQAVGDLEQWRAGVEPGGGECEADEDADGEVLRHHDDAPGAIEGPRGEESGPARAQPDEEPQAVLDGPLCSALPVCLAHAAAGARGGGAGTQFVGRVVRRERRGGVAGHQLLPPGEACGAVRREVGGVPRGQGRAELCRQRKHEERHGNRQ
ncbi:hypothetical protein DFJ74DRAFT_691216 [Hyaloraphidium curvatum]|nr:hypothetical protein DFJ74DRAFT_691216 [Hyaloraphidium curvatum]